MDDGPKKETEKFYYSYVISQLRRIFNFDGNAEKKKALLNATTKQIGVYKCQECGKTFPRHLVAVDHVEPMIPVSGFDDWNSLMRRLFCPASELQVLCKGKGSCHQRKTNKENQARRHIAKKVKDSE